MKPPVPMLACEFDLHEPVFPLIVQPKLDGFRCLARREEAGWVLYSRGGKVLDLPHIVAALDPAAEFGLVLDGELYQHGVGFQALASMIRRRDQRVEFHVFDTCRHGDGCRMASVRLHWLTTYQFHGPVKRVEHHVVHLRQQLERINEQTLAAGYEGLIIRDPNARYEHKRSWALQKLKPQQDAEFVVIGERAAPKAEHLLVLTCRNDLNAATFDVVLPQVIHDGESCLGRRLTVRFTGRTDNLLPRFATAQRLSEEPETEASTDDSIIFRPATYYDYGALR